MIDVAAEKKPLPKGVKTRALDVLYVDTTSELLGDYAASKKFEDIKPVDLVCDAFQILRRSPLVILVETRTGNGFRPGSMKVLKSIHV